MLVDTLVVVSNPANIERMVLSSQKRNTHSSVSCGWSEEVDDAVEE